jgi:hypothetical protein
MKLDDYRSKITTLLRSIFALRPAILPVNQASVDDYLEGQWSTCVDWTLQAIKQPLAGPHDEILKEKTEPYALELEATLESNLATVGWDIDASNTLTLVAGTARIEHVSCQIYLPRRAFLAADVAYSLHLTVLLPVSVRTPEAACAAYTTRATRRCESSGVYRRVEVDGHHRQRRL